MRKRQRKQWALRSPCGISRRPFAQPLRVHRNKVRRQVRLVTAVSAAFGLFFVSSAPAYVYLSGNPRWMQPTLNMYLQFPGPPFVLTDGSVSYYRSFENALQLWNEQLRDFQFTWSEAPSPAGAPSDGNGYTEVTMSTTIYGQKFDSRTLAVTLTRYSGTVYQ